MSSEALGTITNKVTPAEGVKRSNRLRRWQLQDVAAKLLPEERVCWCCKTRTTGAVIAGKGIEVIYNRSQDRAGYGNLMRCGSVWTCPICAARITAKRREELSAAVKRSGFTKVMITITLQHTREDGLAVLLGALKDSWRRLKMGKGWKLIRARYGIRAYVTASECTYGLDNGWHPHLHALLFIDKCEIDVDRLKAQLSERYNNLLDRHGRWSSEFYGIDVRVGDDNAGAYASKFGLEDELASAPVKDGREGHFSPFQLLAQYSAGEEWAGDAFKEYAAVFKGLRQLVWSKGGRDLLGLGEERADEDIVIDEDPGEVLVTLTPAQFAQVCVKRARGELLEVARSGEAVKVWQYLIERLGITPVDANFFGVVRDEQKQTA